MMIFYKNSNQDLPDHLMTVVDWLEENTEYRFILIGDEIDEICYWKKTTESENKELWKDTLVQLLKAQSDGNRWVILECGDVEFSFKSHKAYCKKIEKIYNDKKNN
ncbi:MAG: hypothetical protein ACR2NY_02425 [Alphaproteobacteria bacterium]